MSPLHVYSLLRPMSLEEVKVLKIKPCNQYPKRKLCIKSIAQQG